MLTLLITLLLGFSNDDEGPHCAHVARILMMGSAVERQALAAEITLPPERLVHFCGVELGRAFGAPERRWQQPADERTRTVEQAWLAAYIRSLPAREAAPWLAKVDFRLVPADTLSELTEHFATGPSGLPVLVEILRRAPDASDRVRLLRERSAIFLQGMAADTTTAAQVREAITGAGFQSLLDDDALATLWLSLPAPAEEGGWQAEVKLAGGDLAGAFEDYARLGLNDAAYRMAAAALAEHLMAGRRLDPLRLIPHGIEYRTCDGRVVVDWNGGRLRGNLSGLSPAMQAALHLRRRLGCRPPPADDDELAAELRFARALPRSPARDGRLAELYRLQAERADYLAAHGQSVAALDLRRELLQAMGRPAEYRTFRSVEHIRTLRGRVRIMLPPDPYGNRPD